MFWVRLRLPSPDRGPWRGSHEAQEDNRPFAVSMTFVLTEAACSEGTTSRTADPHHYIPRRRRVSSTRGSIGRPTQFDHRRAIPHPHEDHPALGVAELTSRWIPGGTWTEDSPTGLDHIGSDRAQLVETDVPSLNIGTVDLNPLFYRPRMRTAP